MQKIVTAISDGQDDHSIRTIINEVAAHQRTELQKLVAATIQHDLKFQSLEEKSQDVLSNLLSLNTSATSQIDKRFDQLHSELDSRDQMILSSLRSFQTKFIQEDSRLRFSQVVLCFLDCLRFDQIEMRHSSIAREHAQTCSWVLKDPSPTQAWSSFSQWLATGAGIYWVGGKAGSGKSTLMKFIWNHPRTTQLLTYWAGKARLLCASFFFWNSGEGIQSSQEGLFRTLMYQLCRHHPELLPKAFPDEWETLSGKASSDLKIDKAAPKSLAELKDAFERIVACACQSLKMCVFIDGFDETEGDLVEITDFIVQVSQSSPYFKVCLSSRPWPVFETSFGGRPLLRMQDLNGDDIRLFCHDKLGHDDKVRTLLGPEPGKAEWLITEVVSRACGVFLWVRLVVNLLIQGIQDGDDTMALYRRLLSLPVDLKSLFDRILAQIEPIHRAEASQIFQIFRANGNSLDILMMDRALKYAPPMTFDHVLRMKVTPLSVVKTTENRAFFERIIARGIRRLNSRCRGLLEINEGGEEEPADMTMEELEQFEIMPSDRTNSQAYGAQSPSTLRHLGHQDACSTTKQVEDDPIQRPDTSVYGRPPIHYGPDVLHCPNPKRRRMADTYIGPPSQGGPDRVYWGQPKSKRRPMREPHYSEPRTSQRSRDPLQVTIRYLHRTARDYIEQPHVWSRILDMSAPFNPNTALLAAAVVAVKMSHRQLQPSAAPQMTPSSFARYLQTPMSMPSALHVRLIVDLDTAFEARSIEEGIEELDTHAPKKFSETWEDVGPFFKAKTIDSTPLQGYELASEVRGAVPWYGSLSDKDGGVVSDLCLTDNQGLPLGFSAISKSAGIPAFSAMTLSWHMWAHWLSRRSDPTGAVPRPGSISLLQSLISTPEHGPDSYKFNGHTLWEYVVTLVHNLSDMYGHNQIFEPWLVVFEIMLDNDADPCASCIHDSQEFVDAVTNFKGWDAVPSTVTSHTTPARVAVASAGYDAEQWNPDNLFRYRHSVEAVVRDVFVRRKIPGAERLLNLLHEKKRMWEDLNVRRQDDADSGGGGIEYPHWVS